MKTIGERIRKMRFEKKWTQKDLALHLGLKNDTAIANYESNYSIPKDDIKYKLCGIFNCTMDYLMGQSYYRNYEDFQKIDEFVLNCQKTPEEVSLICNTLNYINTHKNENVEEIVNNATSSLSSEEKEKMEKVILHLHYRYRGKLPQKEESNVFPIADTPISVPVLGKISAGLPLLATEHIEGYEFAPSSYIKSGFDYFYLRVTGDSMNLKFNDRDIVLVQKQDTLENDEIGVIMIDGMDATVKKYKYENGLVILSPLSTNPENVVQIYNPKDISIKIVGKVVSYQGKV